MKKITISVLTICLISLTFSCGNLQSITDLPGVYGTSQNTSPTNYEINSGLKQALGMGIKQGVNQVSAKDGFFKDPLIKILFPPQAQKVENTLRQIGLGNLCDNLILSLNRAAEDATKEAMPIFVNALKQMSFQDASNILLGPDTAATHYFKGATTQELVRKFSPIITKSLHKVDATKYWRTAMTQYNRIPLVKPVNTDLEDYVTHRAIDGLFTMVAEKEINIRGNLSARTTPLLKKVFGYAAEKK